MCQPANGPGPLQARTRWGQQNRQVDIIRNNLVADVTFKPAQLSDVDTPVALMREYYEFDRLPFDAQIARQTLTTLIQDDALGYMWLIQVGAQAVGYVVLTLDYSLEYRGRGAYVDELYLQEAFRGQGIGAQALGFVEEVARSLGLHALHLEVDRHNTRAQAVYRKAGFEDHDRYLMTKWLNA